MAFHTNPDHPSVRCYVVKLHRDALPQVGYLCGRVEHIASGDHADFTSTEALLDWLLQHAAGVPEPASRAGTTEGASS